MSCPVNAPSQEIRELLFERDFDIAGVKQTEHGDIIGYIDRTSLEYGTVIEHMNEIPISTLIADSTPMADLFGVLRNKHYVFVLSGQHVVGIITRADLNKPPVRIYLFGLISLLEMHMVYWIRNEYEDSTWENSISPSRLMSAQELFEERKRRNQEIDLLECLQYGDKRDLLLM